LARPLVIITALAVFGVAATGAHRAYRRATQSPFPVWDYKPGREFASINEQAVREAKTPFTCDTLGGGARLCTLQSTGIAGLTRIVVDSAGRAVVIQFLPDSETAVMRDEARRMAAEWNLVRPATMLEADLSSGERSVAYWATVDGHWSATMRHGRFPATPTLVSVTDGRRLARMVENDPVLYLRLATLSMLDRATREDYQEAVRKIFAQRAARVIASGARGSAWATEAAALPLCEREYADAIEGAGAPYDARTNLGETRAAILERAFAAAYPGWRLQFGAKVYAVDPAGQGEEVEVGEPDDAADGVTTVFPLYFPRRAGTAERAALDFDPVGDCRAPATLLLARRNAKGALVDVLRIDVDEEAMWTHVLSARFAVSLPGRPLALGLRYAAAYGSEEWSGSVDWEALVEVDSVRVTRRIPVSAARKTIRGIETALVLSAADTGSAGLHLTGIAPGQREPLPVFIVLPPGPRGPASGWMLLDMF
jgi:hypothetical protein